MFLAFQYPTEVPGVSVVNFLRTAYKAVKGEEISALAFRKHMKEKMSLVAIPEADRALAVLESRQVWLRAATFEYCIAVACADLGRHEEALARYDHALAMYDLVGENVELRKGHVETQLDKRKSPLRALGRRGAIGTAKPAQIIQHAFTQRPPTIDQVLFDGVCGLG